MFIKPENWRDLGVDERIQLRLKHVETAEGIAFDSPEAEKAWRRRLRILHNAIQCTGASRVPALPVVGSHLVKRAGITGRDTLYNYDCVMQPVLDFHKEFEPDVGIMTAPMPARVWDMLDYKVYIWSGHGLPDSQTFQTVDGEYMSAEDYPALLRDPSGYWLRHYLPRVFGALAPLRKMPTLPTFSELPQVATDVLPFAMPDVQEMLHKLMAAGTEAMKCLSVGRQIAGRVAAAGYPSLMSPPFAKAPFDILGDTLRGTQGIMTDLYRRPEQVKAACATLAPIIIDDTVRACDFFGRATVMFPLHKGADAFMSVKQFRDFYWPTLRTVMEGLNAEGIIPMLFAEGSYNQRLEIIADYPARRTMWFFDQSDMRRVADLLGGNLCVMGNVPSSLMFAGTIEKLRAYCMELLELFAPTGGFILANGAGIDKTTDEHVRTLINVVR